MTDVSNPDKGSSGDTGPDAFQPDGMPTAAEIVGRRASLSDAGRRGWQILGVVLGAAAIGWIIVKIALVVAAIILAVLIAAVAGPAVNRLHDRGWKRNPAALTVTSGWVFVLMMLVAVVGWRLADKAPQLADQLSLALERLRNDFPALPLDGDRFMSMLGSGGDSGDAEATQNVAVGGAVVGAKAISGLLLAVVLSFFFVRDGESMWRSFLDLFVNRQRQRVDAMGRAAYDTVSEYVHGLVVVALADAILSAIGLFALGVPLASVLAVLTFLAAFVPAVGAFVVGGLAAAFAFAAGGLQLALVVIVLYTVIQQVDSSILQPWIMGQRLPLHPAAVLIALSIGALVAGVVGALLAVPIGASIVAASKAYLQFGLEVDVLGDTESG